MAVQQVVEKEYSPEFAEMLLEQQSEELQETDADAFLAMLDKMISEADDGKAE